ncbi:hypothetical protein [Methylomagnum ishizawai]|uniref:hypothetical protein n=1 Tax=Methylomagnum ishizawai TaxID=1760988 RepID=UPI001C33CC77|nr:hypothetical protein [Methylomagnum ishizawai]BBL77548.1 hypothetical protein MishRS11D_46460 [Methylomagnum ishizawai]
MAKVERTRLDFELEEIPSLRGLGSDKPEPTPEQEKRMIEEGEKLGFVDRQPREKRSRRIRSPFTEPLGIRVRPGIKELFQDLGAHLGVYDHTTFEKALLALIEKEGTPEQKERLKLLLK